MAENRRMRAVLRNSSCFLYPERKNCLSACGVHTLRRYGISGGQRGVSGFFRMAAICWKRFCEGVPESFFFAGKCRSNWQRAFRPYGTRQLPHSGLSGRIGNPFAAHRPGGPPHTYYPPSYSPALVFRKNGNGPHAQHFIFFSIVCPDDGRCINDVSRRCGCRGRRLHPAPG